jgi:hypothetical protein
VLHLLVGYFMSTAALLMQMCACADRDCCITLDVQKIRQPGRRACGGFIACCFFASLVPIFAQKLRHTCVRRDSQKKAHGTCRFRSPVSSSCERAVSPFYRRRGRTDLLRHGQQRTVSLSSKIRESMRSLPKRDFFQAALFPEMPATKVHRMFV